MKLIELLPIVTDRLVLMQTSRDYIDLILKMDKQEDTQLFLGGIKVKSREERLEFLDKKNKNGNSLTVFFDNVPIGFVGLKVTDNSGEISYIFDNDYTGNGYATECVSKLVDVGFNELNLDYLYAYSKEDNVASRTVLLKANFKFKEYRDEFMYFERKR